MKKLLPKQLTDTWWGNIILGFSVAVIFYYVILSTVLSTRTPIVAVVSDSMYHGPNDRFGTLCGESVSGGQNLDKFWEICDNTYQSFGITKGQFEKFPFRNGFDVGDMPIIKGSDEYHVGDIIVYSVSGIGAPIIHRVIDVKDGIYKTKGDNNAGQNIYENSVVKEQIKGKVIFIIPKIGYFKVLTNRVFGV